MEDSQVKFHSKHTSDGNVAWGILTNTAHALVQQHDCNTRNAMRYCWIVLAIVIVITGTWQMTRNTDSPRPRMCQIST